MRDDKSFTKGKVSEISMDEFKKRIRGKTLMDDKFMSAFFKDFPEGMELVLQIIIDRPDLEVMEMEVQMTMTNLYGRSIRMDVIARDEQGIVYNVEVQKADKGAGYKRAKYHSSMLDAANKNMIGENFDILPKTIVIFICENDIIKAGKPLYRINRHVEETGEIFKDDAQIIYVNGQIKDSSTELGRLMQDFFEPDPGKMNNKKLADQARRLKYSEEGLEMVREYLTEDEWNTALQQGTEQGIEQGATQKAIVTALSLLSLGKNTKEEIALCTGLSIEEVEKLSVKHK